MLLTKGDCGAAGTRAPYGTNGLCCVGGWREPELVTSSRVISIFAGFGFPPEVMSVAVRWYLGYGLSCRDAGELLAGCGVTVDHIAVDRWARRCRPPNATKPGAC